MKHVDGALTREQTRHKQELKLLLLGNPQKGNKLAISVDHNFPDEQQLEAYEYLLDNDMIKLIDVTTRLEAAPGIPMKVFRITEPGLRRKRYLEIAYA